MAGVLPKKTIASRRGIIFLLAILGWVAILCLTIPAASMRAQEGGDGGTVQDAITGPATTTPSQFQEPPLPVILRSELENSTTVDSLVSYENLAATTSDAAVPGYGLDREAPAKIRYKQFQKDRDPEFIFPNLPDRRNFLKKIWDWINGKKREAKIILTDPFNRETQIDAKVDKDRVSIGLKNPREFAPGKYSIRIEVDEDGRVIQEAQEFEWGTLAANTDKTIYKPNDIANIYLGVLDQYGHTVCDAVVTIIVSDPQSNPTQIVARPSSYCGKDNLTEIPDYQAIYQTGGPGIYQMTVVASTPDGNKEFADTFEVRENPEFDITRQGPTRINPRFAYRMAFFIVPSQDFSGTVTEEVPVDFKVIGQNSSTTVEIKNNVQTISWPVEWRAGNTYKLEYEYDAPDISPYIFLLGPLTIGDFSETRQWQVASDSPGFTANPHEDPASDDTRPTNLGGAVTFKANVSGLASSEWYLAICKTNEIATSTDAAPVCPGGEWAVSAATPAASEATASSTISASSTLEAYDWYGFACEKTAVDPQCSPMSNTGTSGTNGSPLSVNHAPTLGYVSNNGPKDPGASLTVTGYFMEGDTANATDTVSMHICKANDFTGSACGPAGTWCSASSTAAELWRYRKQISISGQAGAGTNYQIKLLIGETSGAAGENFDLEGHAANFPNDIKFTSSDGIPLDYWLESVTGVAPDRLATVWVEVASNLDANQNIYIHYGKPGQSSLANGKNTFNFFEDFISSIPAGWTTPTNDSYRGYTFENDNFVLYGGVRGKSTLWWSGNGSTYNTATQLNGRIYETKFKAYQAGTLRTYQYAYMVGISAGDSLWGRYVLANRWLQLVSSGSVRWNTTPWNGALTDYRILGLAFDGNYRRAFENYVLQTSNDVGAVQADSTFSISSGIADTIGDGRYEGYYDWVRLRKFIAVEPGFYSSGAEESSGHDFVSCSLTIPAPQAAGDFGYYPYMVDIHGMAATGAVQGVMATSTINNIGAEFSVAPHEYPVSNAAAPVNVGAAATFKATANDGNNDQWYLAVCRTNAITANSNAAPTCPGGEWAVSTATDSGSPATASGVISASSTIESYEWFAFACEKNSFNPQCSAMSNSGTGGGNGSPFYINHAPLLSSISDNGPKNPGGNLTISAAVNDYDTANATDTVSMHICKANDFTGSACGLAGAWCSASVPGSGTSWRYRKQISISGQAGAGTGYQIPLLIGETADAAGENFDLNGHCADFPNDIKFTSADGAAELPYWVESVTGAAPNRLAKVWIKVSANLDSGQNIYVHYGNSLALSQSNGRSVFDLFDDWESGKDVSYWNFSGSVSPYWDLAGANKYAGAYSIGNTDISDNQSVYFNKSIALAAASRLEFYWSVSSESGWDYLYYCVNNDSCTISGGYAGRISGNVGWTSVGYNLSSGANSIKFGYGKDSSVSSGSDTGWVDNIRVRKYVATEPAFSSAAAEELLELPILSCNLTVPDPAGILYAYYPYVVDNHGLSASGILNGVRQAFSVNPTPPAPANMRAVSVSKTQIDLEWDANGNPGGTDYYVEIVGGGNSGWAADLGHSFSDLVCGNNYNFRVKAKNGYAIESAWSVLTAATQPCPQNGIVGGQYKVTHDETITSTSSKIMHSVGSKAFAEMPRDAVFDVSLDSNAPNDVSRSAMPSEESSKKEFVLAPNPTTSPLELPSTSGNNSNVIIDSFSILVSKFPGLQKTFSDFGIISAKDFSKAANNYFSLPGISKILGGRLSQTTQVRKNDLPMEFIFAQRSDDFDLEAKLRLNVGGDYEQIFRTATRQPLRLAVKVSGDVERVSGYLTVKNTAREGVGIFSRIGIMLASIVDSSKRAPVQELTMQKFAYVDTDGDGIYLADIQTPGVRGNYQIKTEIQYLGQTESKNLMATLLVDPEGYIYTASAFGQARIEGAQVSLYWMNPDTGIIELWPARDYQQANPQITDITGQYSFFVPAGKYYLEISAKNLRSYKGQEIEMAQAGLLNQSIKLEQKQGSMLASNWWILAIIVFFAAVIALVGFYLKKRSMGNSGNYGQ